MKYCIFGIGNTCFSVIDFFSQQNISTSVFDTRDNPPFLDKLSTYSNINEIYTGSITEEEISNYDVIIVSPGIPYDNKHISLAKKLNKKIISDIDLFLQNESDAKIILVTGTNGKSTISSLIAHILSEAGFKCCAIGNIGIPVLNKLNSGYEYLVLEISSFQLEHTTNIRSEIAVFSNLDIDHINWHKSFYNYLSSKHKVFSNTQTAVTNKDNVLTYCLKPNIEIISASFNQNNYGYGILNKNSQTFLCYKDTLLINCNKFRIKGMHNYYNYLIALIVSNKLGVSVKEIDLAMHTYSGLKYRCEEISTNDDVLWINDSKSTNFNSTMAAINGMKDEISGEWYLILGGQLKGDSIDEFYNIFNEKIKYAIFIGEASLSLSCLASKTGTHYMVAKSLQDAVNVVKSKARPGDGVLFSPGFASFDMYRDYNHRGLEFENAVKSLD